MNKDSNPIAGGKGANLGIMYNLGLPVPPGFVVTSYSFKHYIQVSGLDKKIFGKLKKLNVENNDQLQETSKWIQEQIVTTPMPDAVREEIIEAYEEMDVNGSKVENLMKGGNGALVAVRSSATAEDQADASFAGQQASFMNVKGHRELIAHVLACWASLYTARAIYYRVKNNYPHEKVYIAVVVQKMINSDSAGVMFSVNVVTNDTKEILIEAAYGLGEAVVSGSITPDEFVLDKKTLDVKSKKIAKKTWMYVRDPKTFENIKKMDVPKDLQEESCLKSSEIQKLAELAIKIEKHYGKPQDIEFAIEKGKLYIVQSRPVTTLNKEVKKDVVANAKIAKGDIELKDATMLVSGLPASFGVGKGKVVMVRDLADLKKVMNGDILVARMTTPDMVPAMQRASGIVTDEGGSTCFAGKTKVLTNKGFKTMEELYESEERLFVPSLNRDSLKIEWKPVLACMKRRANAIEIGCSQTGKMLGNNLILTPDHKMLTYSNCELVDRKISEVLINHEMLLIANSMPAFRYCRDMNLEKAYLLGALVSDGYIRFNNRRGNVTFCQKNTDEKQLFIGSVKRIMTELSGRNVYSCRKKVYSHYLREKLIVSSDQNYNHTVCSKAFAQELLLIKSNLTEIFLECNEDVIYNFLAGVIDGDGSYCNSRINIYCGKKGLTEIIVLACMRVGIIPQVTKNRNIDNIQIVENFEKILNCTKRVKGVYCKSNGVRFFSGKQLLNNFIDEVNFGGKIKPYVKSNLLIDSNKIKEKVLPLCSENNKQKLNLILKSDTRMIRTNFVSDVGEIDVFNITVLDNHNYVVFTDKLTPILVNNCHAAIVSREMGIPCIVGTEMATKKLKEGMFITIDATKGKVYSGNVSIEVKAEEKPFLMKTKVKVKVIMDLPELAEHAAASGADGVGLLRSEFINMENRVHPVYMIEHGRREEFISNLVENLKKVVKAFKGKPVWYRTLDARTDEFRNLKGGEEEPKEDNPMMGWRSIRRSLDQPELLTAEYEAIARVYKAGFKNIGIMIPLVTDNIQVREAKKIFYEHTGIKPVKEIQFGVMIETPAAVQMIDEICREGISFISLGTNDLTQFTLACDRNSARVAKLYDEMHPAVLRQIHKVMTTCKKYNLETSICGQAGSKEEMAKFLHKEGINSVSANVDAVNAIRKTFAKVEGLIK
ncbi:phosphoenolpyruvate synthase [Candidatus Woesearchaeota archaeon]|nr:phosphoenolpyruvate synthase [Candidatus Woesearchaeota archaeon]